MTTTLIQKMTDSKNNTSVSVQTYTRDEMVEIFGQDGARDLWNGQIIETTSTRFGWVTRWIDAKSAAMQAGL